MRGTRRGVDHALKQGARRYTAWRATRRSHGALSVAAIALAVVLLSGSGLLIRSFLRLTAERFGFEPQNLLTLRISLPANRYGGPEAQRGAAERLLREVRSLPGVKFVSISDWPLLEPPGGYSLEIEGKPDAPDKRTTGVLSVSSDHFRTMGIPVLAGREFEDRDGVGAPPVAVVSDVLRRRVWGIESAIGKRIRTRSDEWLTVVGVVGDTRLPRSSRPPGAVVYQPFAQPDSNAMMSARTLEENRGHADTRQWLDAVANLTVSIRTVVPPEALASAVRARVAAIDADIPAFDLATMEERLARTVERDRFNMILLSSFAVMALLLATVGVYGVTDYGVRRRTQEIGVRVALGAPPERILRMVLLETARATLLGLALGGVAAFFVTRLLKALLFGVGVRDPLALVTAAAIVLLVSLTAGYIPSRRATRIDPALALRHE